MATKKAATPAKKSANSGSRNSSEIYTRPEVRETIKKRAMAGNKGGRPGQWSARKAQLVVQEYETAGGGYKRPRSPAQKSLKTWGNERWRTSDGKKAVRGKATHRYLPDAAWKELSPKARKATDRKKVAGSKRGRQFVPNIEAASKARKHTSKRNGGRARGRE